MTNTPESRTETAAGPSAWDAVAAVADTLIPHPVYDIDHVWNAGVHATIDWLAAQIPTAEEGSAR